MAWQRGDAPQDQLSPTGAYSIVGAVTADDMPGQASIQGVLRSWGRDGSRERW